MNFYKFIVNIKRQLYFKYTNWYFLKTTEWIVALSPLNISVSFNFFAKRNLCKNIRLHVPNCLFAIADSVSITSTKVEKYRYKAMFWMFAVQKILKIFLEINWNTKSYFYFYFTEYFLFLLDNINSDHNRIKRYCLIIK